MNYTIYFSHLLLLFLILISLSFCKEKKIGFIIPMEGTNIYNCNSEFICDKEDNERKIPYATQIEYYTKQIKTNTIYTYYEAKYQDKTIFVKIEDLGSEKKIYYFKVFPFDGVSLRSKDDIEIGKISFGEKVEFLGLADNDKYLVRFKHKEGIIDAQSLIEFKEHEYFKVSTFHGLHLRESPSIKSKILVTLPYQTVGEIIEADKTIYTIQDRKGYWIQTSYENKIGWLFSGFVFISANRNNFEKEEKDPKQGFFKFFTDLHIVTPMSYSELRIDGKNKKELPAELEDFYFVSTHEEGNECTGPISGLFYIKSKPKFYYDINEGEENLLLKDEGKIFITSYQGCKDCCCYYGGERIFFVMNNQLAWNQLDFYSPSGGSRQKKCETNIQTVRFNKKDSTAYLYVLYGDCENQLTSIMDDFQKFYESEKYFKSYTHDMFIKIKINEDNLDIKRILDKGIPSEYKQEWEEAEEIWKKEE